MGIINENASFLCEAKQRGVSFGQVLTLGRQNVYLSKTHADQLARTLGLDLARARSAAKQGYADDFIRQYLGATDVQALDYSDYEGAQIVHDMNLPLPAELEEKFDSLIDGGALEHIFNFPVALANCMRVVKTGGTIFLGAPANNQLGHGFYQFSPELFYRCLSEDTGFQVERLFAIEMKYMGGEFGARGKPVSAIDPADVGARGMIANAHPLHLMIQARKTRHISDPFAKPPQQSDYSQAWQKLPTGRPQESMVRATLRTISKAMPQPVRTFLLNEYGRLYGYTLRNRKFWKTP